MVPDPSFQKFIEELQKQNTRSFGTQLLQLKYEKEIAGEDGDRREEQLQELIDATKSLRGSLTGIGQIDFSSVESILGNQKEYLTKQLEELTLIRKINEGSLEYDKESAQYRNTSGRELESVVSGKSIKKGGYIDFESAADRLTGQGKRVREQNQLKLLPEKSSGIGVSAAGGLSKPDDRRLSDITVDKYQEGLAGFKEMGKDWASLFGYKGGGKESWSVEKDRYASEYEKAGMGTKKEGMLKYEEITAKEREDKKRFDSGVDIGRASNSESDNVESESEKQTKIASEDLDLTKEQKNLAEKQVELLKEIRAALDPSVPEFKTKQKKAETDSTVEEKESGGLGLTDLLPSRKTLGKALSKTGKGLGKLGSLALKGAKFLGPVAAAAGAAYSGFGGYQNTAQNFDLKEGEEATLGQKTSSTLGGLASGLTFGLVDEKSAAQGIHKFGSSITDWFSGKKKEISNAYNKGIFEDDGVVNADSRLTSNQTLKTTSDSTGKSTENFTEGITNNKTILGSETLGALFTKKGKTTGSIVGISSTEENGKPKLDELQGERISGGLFGADKYKFYNNAAKSNSDYELEVNKDDYFKAQELVKQGKIQEAKALVKEAAAKKQAENLTPLGEITGETPSPVANNILSENAKLKTDTSMARPTPAAVVSNNVTNTTKQNFMPVKAQPRSSSSLDRYQDRITVY